MKNLKFFLLYFFMLFLITSQNCVTTNSNVGKAGALPKKWWTMNRGDVQNYFRNSSTGQHKNIIIFIGKSDSALNVDEATAIENARMDAFQLLSRYLSQKVTGIQQSGKHIEAIQEAVQKGKLTKEQADALKRKVEERMNTYAASITVTQFSSFKQEATHVEKVGNRYRAYVCYSMSDQILEETKKLQTAAFESLVKETEEYVEIIKKIQEVIANQMLQTIMNDTGL